MTREETIEQLNLTIGFIKQDGKDWLDDRDIPMLEECAKALSQEPMREFTKEEAKAYSKALDKMYKPTGLNVFNESCDAISREAVMRLIENKPYDWSNLTERHNMLMEIRRLPSITLKPIECDDAINRILTKMWNCRGKHTISIDKVKMEQIIRNELSSVTSKPIECDDTVSRGVLEQVMRERDIAIEQLHELGYELGQKIEPCDDAISRDAVLKTINNNTADERDGWLCIDNDLVHEIEQLPSVTPKSGHWIPIPYELDYETDAECSLCHEKFIDAINYDYCPKCGYRMQESEDK